jgi:hypothetical protein
MEILQLWNSRTGPFTHLNHLQMIDGWDGPIHICRSGSGWWLSRSPHQGKLSSTVLAKLFSATIHRRQSHLSCSHALKASSPTPRLHSQLYHAAQSGCGEPILPSSPALTPSRLVQPYLCHQSQLHCVAQAMQCAVLALLSAIASERAGLGLPLSWPQGQISWLLKVARGRGHHPCTHATSCQTVAW